MGEIPTDISDNCTLVESEASNTMITNAESSSTGTQVFIILDRETEMENELARARSEIDRVNNEKSRHRNENIQLKMKITQLEDQAATSRREIKAKVLEKIKKNTSKEAASKSTQSTNTSYEQMDKEHRKQDNKLLHIQESLETKTKEYTKVNNDKKNLQQQVKQLQDHEKVLRKLLEDSDLKIKEAQRINLNSPSELQEDGTMHILANDIHKLINDRFDKIEDNIGQLINDKLADKITKFQQIESKIDEAIGNNKSYADAAQTSDATNLTNLIKLSKNE